MTAKRVMNMLGLYAPTLKEDPTEAELASHRLLLRAGMIRKQAAGLYSYLPLAWRSLKKIEAIVRDEMDAARPGVPAPDPDRCRALARVRPLGRVRSRAHAAS